MRRCLESAQHIVCFQQVLVPFFAKVRPSLLGEVPYFSIEPSQPWVVNPCWARLRGQTCCVCPQVIYSSLLLFLCRENGANTCPLCPPRPGEYAALPG